MSRRGRNGQHRPRAASAAEELAEQTCDPVSAAASAVCPAAAPAMQLLSEMASAAEEQTRNRRMAEAEDPDWPRSRRRRRASQHG